MKHKLKLALIVLTFPVWGPICLIGIVGYIFIQLILELAPDSWTKE